MTQRLQIGVNLPARLAQGQGQVGPRFTSLPLLTKTGSSTLSYHIGTTNEGTVVSTLYRDNEVLLSNLTTNGTIPISASDSGLDFQIESVAQNSNGNSTKKLSAEYTVTIPPTVPAPDINLLETTTTTMMFEVLFPAIIGNYLSENIIISDGIDTFVYDMEGIEVIRGGLERDFVVIRTVIDVFGDTIVVSATSTILAQTQVVVFEPGVYEPGVYY